MTRAVIYCRISQDRRDEHTGVDRQEQQCRALAKSRGWDVVEVFTDNDVSAYSGKTRPAYVRMLGALRAGRASVVIAWHTDRLHRSPRELEEYVDVCEAHAVVTHTVKAGELDLSTPSGRAVARTVGAWARFESEHKADRIKAAHAQAAARGKWRGGARPYGWALHPDGTVTLNEDEAKVVREVVDELLCGASFGSQVKRLNARGVTTSRGNRWCYTSLRQVITRPKNAGFSELNGEIVGKMEGWPPILSEDAWRAVCARFTDPSTRQHNDSRARWLLSGIAHCGKCGRVMTCAHITTRAGSGRARRVVYRCPGDGTTGHAGRGVGPVNEVTEAKMKALLARDGSALLARMAPPGPDVDQLREQSVALRGRLDEAAAGFADGGITGSQLRTITQRIEARLAEVESQLVGDQRARVLAQFSNPDEVSDRWDALTLDHKRSVIRAAATVTIHPAGRGVPFDPSIVEVRVHA